MRIPIAYDPKQHKIRVLPITRTLRQACQQNNLVTCFNTNYNVWVVALQSKDGRELVEIDFLCGANPHEPWASQADVERIRQYFKPARPVKEIIGEWRDQTNQEAIEHCEEEQKFTDACLSLARSMHRRFGAVTAEHYLHRLGHGSSALHYRG